MARGRQGVGRRRQEGADVVAATAVEAAPGTATGGFSFGSTWFGFGTSRGPRSRRHGRRSPSRERRRRMVRITRHAFPTRQWRLARWDRPQAGGRVRPLVAGPARRRQSGWVAGKLVLVERQSWLGLECAGRMLDWPWCAVFVSPDGGVGGRDGRTAW